jgi:DNA modification methylase
MSHNTEKPVELFVRPIKKHTSVGAIVFEPFSGSGSQLIAAERTGRRCRAIEISPPFVDVAIRRWQKATGQEATLETDGKTFAAVAATALSTLQHAGQRRRGATRPCGGRS